MESERERDYRLYKKGVWAVWIDVIQEYLVGGMWS
jgi:hypothetical protein